jgi:hypothetical protein
MKDKPKERIFLIPRKSSVFSHGSASATILLGFLDAIEWRDSPSRRAYNCLSSEMEGRGQSRVEVELRD